MATTGEQYFELAVTAETPRSPKDGLFACPCCESYCLAEAGGFEICEVCGWEDDPTQEVQPGLAGGANKVSLIQARETYRLTGHSDPAARRRPRLP